ncbi:CapA family protein [Candidatus Falkowbacteria bacterium]|nr:CapA family protein [Candidatus Falkowbacteria bacterium]
MKIAIAIIEFFLILNGTSSSIGTVAEVIMKPDVQKIEMVFVGDMMLDRDVYRQTKKDGKYDYPFIKIDAFLSYFDLRVGNLEGPITRYDSSAVYTNGTRFTFSPEYIEELGKRFNVLSLANNHTRDFGTSGLEQTKEYLTEEGINYFGDRENDADKLTTIIEYDEIKIGFVGYNGMSRRETEKIENEIKNVRHEVDFLIVYPHWGIEYQGQASRTQKEEAHVFIDAGADLVVGSHPHVVQTVEIYNEGVIVYSLGNFIFDQYFSQATMQGLALGVKLWMEDGVLREAYQFYPIEIDKVQPKLASLELTGEMLGKLGDGCVGPEEIKQGIREGEFVMQISLERE